MRSSRDRILTTHVGKLPPSAAFAELEKQAGPVDESRYNSVRAKAVMESVRQQVEIGIDIISDGEIGKTRGYPYYSRRLDGIAEHDLRPGEFEATVYQSREREQFRDIFVELDRIRESRRQLSVGRRMVCVGPLRHKDNNVLDEEIGAFKTALTATDARDGFFPVQAPGWLDHFLFNEHYKTEEEFIYAIAEALRHEYREIVDAGLMLQVDDPGLPDAWPTFFPEPSVADYRKYATLRVEALNHALSGIPEDRVRYHVCWGSQHGPHFDDLPFEHIIDLMLRVKAGTYCFEAANPRHEHEWKLWRDIKLPEGKILAPGVVTHHTNIIEHPELVADRILRYAGLVGAENVIAGTDCGFGGRVFPSIAWAKMRALVEGAALASNALRTGRR